MYILSEFIYFCIPYPTVYDICMHIRQAMHTCMMNYIIWQKAHKMEVGKQHASLYRTINSCRH